jgi:L-threonylcarbamoyladenylate synthase
MERIDINDINLLERVLQVIQSGGVVVVPTDTVYGLIADATNTQAVENIFDIKKRDLKKPFGIFVLDKEMLMKYADSDPELLEKLFTVWPGALTAILKSNHLLKFVDDTIGIRVPNSQFLLSLMKVLKKPLVQTSANISKHADFTDSRDVLKDLADVFGIDLFVDAWRLPDSMASTGVDFTYVPPRVIRHGALPVEKLKEVFRELAL